MALKALLDSLDELSDGTKAQIAKMHAADLKAANDRSDKLMDRLSTVMIDQAATKAITDRKGAVKLLLPHVRALSTLKTDGDGAPYVEVVDADGIPQIGGSNGEPMTIDQFVESLRQSDIFARAFEGSGASGGGAALGNPGGQPKGGTRTIRQEDQDAMNNNLEAIAAGSVTVVSGGRPKTGGTRTIRKGDQAAMSNSLEAIAAGTVTVV